MSNQVHAGRVGSAAEAGRGKAVERRCVASLKASLQHLNRPERVDPVTQRVPDMELGHIL